MRKNAKSKGENKEQAMTKEFFAAIEQLAEENSVSVEMLVEKIQDAILRAVKKEYDDYDDLLVNIDPENNIFDICVLRTVVDDEPIDMNEINIDEARAVCDPNAQLGDRVPFKLSIEKIGRVAAQSAKQTIHRDIKIFERDKLINQFKDKDKEAVSAVVQKVEPETGNAVITIDKNEIYFHRNDQIPGEVLKEGQIIKVYVSITAVADKKAQVSEKKPMVKVSRRCNELVKRLFELEIPEIYDGTVEIKGIAREAGSRTKIAVSTKDPNVDPVGACIGPKHSRIEKIVEELNGEKIDIIVYDEDLSVYIAHALAPATVLSVTTEEIDNAENPEKKDKKCTVTVPNNQLSLAIGNKGQNAKLAARLTMCKVDIKPENPIE